VTRWTYIGAAALLIGISLSACSTKAASSSAVPTPTASPTPQPSLTPTLTPTLAATPAASQAPSACAASNLRATADPWQGGLGSRFTSIHITLASAGECLLQGHPGAGIVAGDGSLIVASRDPDGRVDQPWVEPGDRVVTLSGQGSTTTLMVRWGNWCGATPSAPQLQLRLAADGPQLPVALAAGDAIPIPPCSGTAEHSLLDTWPF
jgi:Protein of unknown function (DUF4232)